MVPKRCQTARSNNRRRCQSHFQLQTFWAIVLAPKVAHGNRVQKRNRSCSGHTMTMCWHQPNGMNWNQRLDTYPTSMTTKKKRSMSLIQSQLMLDHLDTMATAVLSISAMPHEPYQQIHNRYISHNQFTHNRIILAISKRHRSVSIHDCLMTCWLNIRHSEISAKLFHKLANRRQRQSQAKLCQRQMQIKRKQIHLHRREPLKWQRPSAFHQPKKIKQQNRHRPMHSTRAWNHRTTRNQKRAAQKMKTIHHFGQPGSTVRDTVTDRAQVNSPSLNIFATTNLLSANVTLVFGRSNANFIRI